jgi:type IX secretion system PorP/SprF family membrane protein
MFPFAAASLNPALTGIYEHDHSEADYRAFTNYRNQWRSIRSPYVEPPTPFGTYSFSTDMRLRSLRFLRYNAIGVGLMAYRDKSGDLNFGTTQFAWSVSFQKSIGRSRRDFLTFGFQQSTIRRSLDFNNASFDSQWNGTGYDPSSPTGENFPAQQFYYQDMNAGISYVHRPLKKDETNWTLGLAYFHFNKPNQSFYKGVYEVTLKPKWLLHGSAKYILQDRYIVYPVFLLMKQGQASEANVTVYGGKKVTNGDLQIRPGLGLRIVSSLENDLRSDAVITSLWFLYKEFDFGFSYDCNFSGLKKATAVKGGFEVFLVYHKQLFRHKSKYQKFRRLPECPNIYDE